MRSPGDTLRGEASPDEAPPRAWQRMLSGRRLDLLDPAPADVAIADIAHGLARVARWNGQTRGPHVFSVAQHSLLVESLAAAIQPDLARPERLTVLLHDAPEYVIGDLISPFKAVVGDAYRAVEARLLAAILARFALSPPDAALQHLIKQADRAAAYAEATQLAGFAADEALRLFGNHAVAAPELVPLSSSAAQAAFLMRVKALGGTDDALSARAPT